MTAELSNAELSRAVALECGWAVEKRHAGRGERIHWGNMLFEGSVECWLSPQGQQRVVPPDFATSLDACFAPGGPVEMMIAQGWGVTIGRYGGSAWKWRVAFGSEDFSHDTSPARALCLAFLAAVATQKARQ